MVTIYWTNLIKNFKLVNNEIKLINQMFYWASWKHFRFVMILQFYPDNYATTLRNSFTAKKLWGILIKGGNASKKFLRILAQPKAIKRALVPMHQFYALDIYLPEWKGIKGLMQFWFVS